jgi:hypothetical protein
MQMRAFGRAASSAEATRQAPSPPAVRPVATRRRLAWIAIALCGGLAAAGAAWSAFGPDKIVLGEAFLQERINRQLPREFRSVTVERATIALADDRISLRVEVRATVVGQAIAATAIARGVPRYDAAQGALFFDTDDVKLDDVTIGTGGLAERADRLGARIGGRLGEQVRDNLPRVEAAAGAVVAAGIKAYLAARPAYRFKDDFKGALVKATVTNIAVAGNTLAIGVSLMGLTVGVGAWLAGLTLVLCAAWWLVRHPLWGLSVMLEGPDAG